MQQTRVFLLMAGLTAFVAFLGGMLGGRGGAAIAFVFATAMNMGMYWFSDRAVQMAISRQNEFQADRTGGEIAGNPAHLADALRRLEHTARKVRMDVNPAAAQLAIINPFSGRGRGMTNLFRTHPPTEERVARLEEQARGSLGR